VCRLWFSADTGDRSEQGTHMFWEQPNGSGTGSTSSLLPHWEDNIPSWSPCYHHLNFWCEIEISGFSEVLNRFGSQINLGKCQKMEKEIKFGGGVKKIGLERT
jgi:hypothetical protein